MGQNLCSLDTGRRSHLQQDSEELLGICGAATVAGILPINVQPIAVVLPEKPDG